MNDLVSIIMPTYNCGRFIRESIDSVLAQSYTNWELLIMDDGSTDETPALVSAYKDARIRYTRNKQQQGAAVVRNKALQEAKGRYMAFLDADDVWLPEKLEKQIAFMEANGYAFTYHEYTEIDETSKPLGVQVSGKKRVTPLDMKCCCWPGCLTVMYDANLVGLVQISDIRKNNDTAMWLQVIRKADCYLLPENLAQYRRRTGSITPPSIEKKIKWHYILFRQGAHMNAFAAAFWTGMNMIGNSYKKIRYVKHHTTV